MIGGWPGRKKEERTDARRVGLKYWSGKKPRRVTDGDPVRTVEETDGNNTRAKVPGRDDRVRQRRCILIPVVVFFW